MKKRLKFIVPLAILSVGCAAFAACGALDFNYPDYSYRNPDFSGKPLEKDEGIVLDGKADEAFWKSEDRNWLTVTKATDEDVSLCATSYIGEKGLYMLFDVNDPAVYVNPARPTYNNSGIELYISADTNAVGNAYEIDLNPDGRTRVSLQSSKGRTVPWYEQFEFGVSMKGGDYNTGECTGYVIEAFFPNRMFGGEKDLFYSDVAVISTVNETSEDREWYPFAQKEYGGAWMKPASWFTFDANGFTGAKTVSLSEGSKHVTLKSFPSAVENFSYTARFEAEEGYAITGLSMNGEPVDSAKLTDAENGVSYRIHNVRENVVFTVDTAPIAAGNKTLSGNVSLYSGGKDTPTGDAQISLRNQAGDSVPVSIDANGHFTLSDLPQGLYTFTVSQAKYKTLVKSVAVNRDRTVNLRLGALSIFDTDNANWDLTEENDGVVTLRYGEGNVLKMAEAQDNFAFGYTVKPSEAALQKSGDLRYGIRASFVSEENKFKNKYLEYDLLYNSNSKKWLIQMPNHDGGSIFANEGYKDVYSLTGLQVDKLLKEGLQIQLVRQGATFYLYVNGVKVVTKTVEGAENVKVVPGFLHFGHPAAVDFAFDYSTDYNAATWDAVTVEEASGIQHGSISFDKQSYAAGDDVVVTAIPADGYILTDILVNGYSYGTEITDDNTLTFKVDAKTIVVEPVFVEATATVACKVVNFPNAEGLQVRLTKNGEVLSGSEKTVVNGKTEFTQIAVGRYGIQIKAFGVWGNTDKILTVNGRGTAATIQIDNAAVYTSGNWTTENNAKASQEISVDGVSVGDGWFVTKVSNLTDIDGEIRFGFRINYEGIDENRDYTILKQNGSWKFQTIFDGWSDCSLHHDFSSWLTKETPFYFAVQRIKESGTLNVFMGAGLDCLVKVGSIESKAIGKNIVRFGLKKEKGAFDVTFSDTRYGATVQEAFGCADGVTITVNNNAPESAIAMNHGAITVSNVELGSAVTLGIQTDTSDPSKRYFCTSVKVNGVERLQDFAQNQLTLSEIYLLDTLNIEATFEFEEVQTYVYAGTAKYFKANAWHDFTDATLVFTDSANIVTEVPVGENGAFSVQLCAGSYNVTVKGSDRYILERTEVTVGTEAQTGVELKAAWRVFALKGCDGKDTVYDYAETIAQNTAVTKTVNGKEITFDGSLPLNKKNGGTLIDDAATSEIAKGNFSVGIYIKIPSDYNVSGDQRMVAPGIRFESGKTFFIFFMSKSATSAQLQTFPNMYNNVVTGNDWRAAALTDAEMSKAKTEGIYVRLVRMGNSYYWMVDDTVIRVDTFTETPKDFMFVRWDQTLETFAYKVEAFEEFKEGTAFRKGTVAIAEEVEGDFEAQITLKSSNMTDYRGGFALNFGGKTINVDMTNNGNTGEKSKLQTNGGISNGWKDLKWPEGNNPVHQAIKNDGCTFKIKRVTTGTDCTIEVILNGATGASETYTMKYNSECFQTGAISEEEFKGKVSISLRADNNVTVTLNSFTTNTAG